MKKSSLYQKEEEQFIKEWFSNKLSDLLHVFNKNFMDSGSCFNYRAAQIQLEVAETMVEALKESLVGSKKWNISYKMDDETFIQETTDQSNLIDKILEKIIRAGATHINVSEVA